MGWSQTAVQKRPVGLRQRRGPPAEAVGGCMRDGGLRQRLRASHVGVAFCCATTHHTLAATLHHNWSAPRCSSPCPPARCQTGPCRGRSAPRPTAEGWLQGAGRRRAQEAAQDGVSARSLRVGGCLLLSQLAPLRHPAPSSSTPVTITTPQPSLLPLAKGANASGARHLQLLQSGQHRSPALPSPSLSHTHPCTGCQRQRCQTPPAPQR